MRTRTSWLRALSRGFTIPAAASISIATAAPPDFDKLAGPFLENYCLGCHDAETKKGEVDLEDLAGVDPMNAELWKRVWEQVALKDMPHG